MQTGNRPWVRFPGLDHYLGHKITEKSTYVQKCTQRQKSNSNLAKIRRRVGENSNKMLKRRPVASIIDEKGELDQNGKSGENGAFGEHLPEHW